MAKIGKNIKYYRHLQGLTQSKVAELSGINEKYLGRLERDESVPTLDKLYQLCAAFDIRINDLLMTRPAMNLECIPTFPANNLCFNLQEVYYCNCCGCTFKSDSSSEISCPNCLCLFDEEDNFIEKSFQYVAISSHSLS